MRAVEDGLTFASFSSAKRAHPIAASSLRGLPEPWSLRNSVDRVIKTGTVGMVTVVGLGSVQLAVLLSLNLTTLELDSGLVLLLLIVLFIVDFGAQWVYDFLFANGFKEWIGQVYGWGDGGSNSTKADDINWMEDIEGILVRMSRAVVVLFCVVVPTLEFNSKFGLLQASGRGFALGWGGVVAGFGSRRSIEGRTEPLEILAVDALSSASISTLSCLMATIVGLILR